LESKWRQNVSDQGLVGFGAGVPGGPIRLAARLLDSVVPRDYLTDIVSAGLVLWVRVPADVLGSYTVGSFTPLTANFPFGFNVEPDR